MNLLKVVANNFKACTDNFTVSFIPSANMTEEDKEYEFIEIAENLYVFSTIGIVGKNASGKTSVVDLLGLIYDIFSNYRIENYKDKCLLWNNNTNLDITFYHDGYLYRYITDIIINEDINRNILFKNQKIYRRQFYKSLVKEDTLFDYSKYEEIKYDFSLPEDISILFNLFKEKGVYGVYYSVEDDKYIDYKYIFKFYKKTLDGETILPKILRILDESLENIEIVNDNKYKVTYRNKKSKYYSYEELDELLSSGTSKGFDLFTLVVFCLKYGKVLIVDEIENHFHKTLVENLINLFKDKTVNKKGAILVFTTHYCELLDLFNRSDNIFITKHEEKVSIENMHTKYGTRNDILKSKKFYKNEFGTNVNYELLMDFKKELMK